MPAPVEPIEPIAPPPLCPEGNVLKGRPRTWVDLSAPHRVSDGVVASEGADWNGPQAAVLQSAGSTTFDLGRPTPLDSLWIQADGNDLYSVAVSDDGLTWRDVAVVPIVDGHGLRGRSVSLGGVEARHLKVGQPEGDGFYSISEVQAYCQPPKTSPVGVRLVNSTAAGGAKGGWVWNDTTSARWEGVLAVLGMLVVGGGLWVSSTGKLARATSGLLAVLGVLGALSFFNFGSLHFGNSIHDWDFTHYHIGAKYFPELGYERLYRCMSVADAEDGLTKRVEARRITNLETNAIESARTVLVDPTVCTSHFSQDRWSAFKKDVKFWRDRQGGKRWDDLQLDHGYNATPVWTLAGWGLAGTAPIDVDQMWLLAALDPGYLVATALVIWWGFGWRVLCVALLVFGTNFPSRFYWTGGSYLRFDWLFYLVASICLARRDRPLLAGAALAYAACLRVFPVLAAAGPGLALLYDLGWLRVRPRPGLIPFFVSLALTSALLVGASTWVTGPEAYPAFVANTVKHQETPLTNHMGLRTALSWRPQDGGRKLRDEKLTDPWSVWKVTRLENWREAKPLAVGIGLGWLWVLWRAVRKEPLWVSVAAGLTVIPIGVELTCYYYAFVIGVALLAGRDAHAGVILLGLTALTQFEAWAPIPGMARWMDEQYVGMSAATIVAFLWVILRLGRSTPSANPP